MTRKTVAVDLDGTLCLYFRWRGPARIGKPIGGADTIRAPLLKLRIAGYRLILFTVRARHKGAKPAIRKWLTRHGLQNLFDDITDRKVPWEVLFDDRAWRVGRNADGALELAVDKWLEVGA